MYYDVNIRTVLITLLDVTPATVEQLIGSWRNGKEETEKQ